jgi:biopolymer transport protein ExbD
MPIIFRCESCNQKLSAPSRKAGKAITCPACGFQFNIPTSETAEPEPYPPERQPDQFTPPVLPAPDDDDEGLVLRKADTEFDDMDLTPMVDVTFLLLIFFMITASFTIQKTIHVPAPNKEGVSPITQEQEKESVSIEVAIDEKNAITVDDEPLADPSSLADVIQTKMRKDQKQELLLSQDVDSLHETTILVIDAANEAGIQKIRIVTRE